MRHHNRQPREANGVQVLDNTRALITGAGGFIGSHLTERLLESGWDVSTVSRSLSGKPNHVRQVLSETRFHEGDLAALLAAETLNHDFDYVFHLAGSASVPDSIAAPAVDLQNNVGLTLALLENVRHRSHKPKLVYLSSAAVYGNPVNIPITEENSVAPISPYGISKLASESYMRVYSEIFGVPTVVVRPFSVYGPRQEKLVIYDLLKQLEAGGTTLNIRGDGTQARDFIHISDVIDAILAIALKAPFAGEAYNIGSGSSVTVKDLVSLLLEATGQARKVVYSDKINAGEPLRWQVDIAKLRALGFSPRVSLKDGLRALGSSFALPQPGEVLCQT